MGRAGNHRLSERVDYAEPPWIQILADEVLLLGTSMGLHYERVAAYPVRATDVQGPFLILDHVLDKRPLLFPVLAASIHDLTGYRPENVFYLNMGLAGIFLAVAYLLGVNAGRGRWPGMSLSSSLPAFHCWPNNLPAAGSNY